VWTRTAFLGERTIARQGCFGCHNVPGFEKASPIGTELTEEGSKLVERLDFGFEEGKIPHSLPAWVHRKLMEPRVFDQGKLKRHEELLRMPKFHFTSEEADAIVTAIMSMTKEQIPAAQKQLAEESWSSGGVWCATTTARAATRWARRAARSRPSSRTSSRPQGSPPGSGPFADAYNEKSKIGEGACRPRGCTASSGPVNHIRLAQADAHLRFSEDRQAIAVLRDPRQGAHPYEPKPGFRPRPRGCRQTL
jgi:hypothetical protein